MIWSSMSKLQNTTNEETPLHDQVKNNTKKNDKLTIFLPSSIQQNPISQIGTSIQEGIQLDKAKL